MKVQAMSDAPERTWQELVDIGFLAKLDGVDGPRYEGILRSMDSRNAGGNSSRSSDRGGFDLDRDLPTTEEDVRRLRELRQQVPGWLGLSAAELDALLPPDDARQRPPASATRRPFSLE